MSETTNPAECPDCECGRGPVVGILIAGPSMTSVTVLALQRLSGRTPDERCIDCCADAISEMSAGAR